MSRIQTGLRLEEETLKKITYIANKEKRSLNAQLEYVTEQCINEYEAKYGVISLDDEQ